MAQIEKANEKQAKIQAKCLDEMFNEFGGILAETFDEAIKANKALQNMDAGKFQDELKNSIGPLMEKLKRFAQTRLKKCSAFKSFEQKHSNSYLCKNLPKELIKKVNLNIKALNP